MNITCKSQVWLDREDMKACDWTVIEKAIHGSTVSLQIILLSHLYYTAFVWSTYLTRYLSKAQLLWQKSVHWIILHRAHSSCSASDVRQHTWSAWQSQQSFLCKHISSAALPRAKMVLCFTSLREMLCSVSSLQHKQTPKDSELDWDPCKFLLN